LKPIHGKYEYFNETDGFYWGLNLLSDSTFKYLLTGHLINVQGDGIWSRKNSFLILNSFDSLGIISAKENRTNSKNIKVKINYPDSLPFGYGSVCIDTTNFDTTHCFSLDSLGVGYYKAKKIKYLVVYFLGEKYSYHIKDTLSNEYELIIAMKDISKPYFVNEKYTIKNESIFISDRLKLRKINKFMGNMGKFLE